MLAFTAVGMLASCRSEGDTTARRSETIPVVTIRPTNIEIPRSYVADIQAVQFVEIKPKVEGFVQQVLVDEGQLVEKEREVVSMKVEQARANFQLAQTNYSYTTITAPFTGYIDRIPYKVGSLVNPTSLLTTVSDISEIFAYYKVNESEYLQWRRAQLQGRKDRQLDNIELILSDGSIYPHRGVQEAVEGDFERGTGSIAFRVRFPNPEGLLKHGVTGKIRMLTSMNNISLIPQKSTFEIQDFTYVYTVDSVGITRVRSFTPIERYQNYYVTQDFEPGTTIVYEGVQTLKDGMHVKTDTIPAEEMEKELQLDNLKK